MVHISNIHVGYKYIYSPTDKIVTVVELWPDYVLLSNGIVSAVVNNMVESISFSSFTSTWNEYLSK